MDFGVSGVHPQKTQSKECSHFTQAVLELNRPCLTCHKYGCVQVSIKFDASRFGVASNWNLTYLVDRTTNGAT